MRVDWKEVELADDDTVDGARKVEHGDVGHADGSRLTRPLLDGLAARLRPPYLKKNIAACVVSSCLAQGRGSGKLFTCFEALKELSGGGLATHTQSLLLIISGRLDMRTQSKLTVAGSPGHSRTGARGLNVKST